MPVLFRGHRRRGGVLQALQDGLERGRGEKDWQADFRNPLHMPRVWSRVVLRQAGEEAQRRERDGQPWEGHDVLRRVHARDFDTRQEGCRFEQMPQVQFWRDPEGASGV